MTKKDWLILSVFIFLIAAVWITLEIYHTYTTSSVAAIEQNLSKPLVPKFDNDTIIKLVEEN